MRGKGDGEMTEAKDSFADLEKVRLNILKDKINEGLAEFKASPTIQWTPVRLEKPLLETLSKIISENEALKIEVEHLRIVSSNCECEDIY